jgi:ubiquinone/menaquinone biosynthesis C-methylase UbiE
VDPCGRLLQAQRSSVIEYDQIALEYARHRKVHPGVLGGLMARSDIDSGSRVLEVGCGTGNYIAAIQAATGCSCWAIDPSEEMLDAARGGSPGVTFQLGRAEWLEFEPGSFDLVFSVDVIHHVKDHLAHFQDVYRVLKPRGLVCTVTDSELVIRHREPLAVYFPETVEVDLQRYPRMAALRALMQEAGFDEIEEHTVEFPYEVEDSRAYRDRAFSALHLISEKGFEEGLRRMERDLESGPIQGLSRYVLLWGSKGAPRAMGD